MANHSKALGEMTQQSLREVTWGATRDAARLYFEPLACMWARIAMRFGRIPPRKLSPGLVAEVLDSVLLWQSWRNAHSDALMVDRQRLSTLHEWLKDAEHIPELRARITETLASSLATIGDFATAEKLAREALIQLEVTGTRAELAAAVEGLALIYTREGKLEKAEELFQRAFILYEALQNRRALASGWASIAAVYSKSHNRDKAEKFLRQALALNRELGDELSAAAACLRLALISEERKDLARASEWFRNALVHGRRFTGESSSMPLEDQPAERPTPETILKVAVQLFRLGAATQR